MDAASKVHLLRLHLKSVTDLARGIGPDGEEPEFGAFEDAVADAVEALEKTAKPLRLSHHKFVQAMAQQHTEMQHFMYLLMVREETVDSLEDRFPTIWDKFKIWSHTGKVMKKKLAAPWEQ